MPPGPTDAADALAAEEPTAADPDPALPPVRRSISGRDLIAVGLVLLGFVLPLRGLWHYQGPSMEEGFMLAFPQRVLHGDVPNKDFLHLYGPGSLWVLAAVFKVFGSYLQTERAVGLVQHMGLVFGVFAVARPWGRRLAVVSAGTALVIIIGPIGLTALAWNGAVALGMCSLAVGLRGRRRAVAGDGPGADRALVVAGVLAGAALLYRPDLVVAVSLATGAVLWGLERKRIQRFLVPALATAALYLVQFAMAGPGNAIRGMFLDPVFHLRGGRSLPVPPSAGHFDGWLQKAAGLVPRSWPLPSASDPRQVWLWFLLLPCAALFVAGVGIWRTRVAPGEWRSRVLLAAGLFGLGLMPQAFQRPDTAHLAWVSCISLAFAPVALTEVLRAFGRPLRGQRAPAVAALGIAVLLVFVIPFQTTELYTDLVGQSFGHNVRGAAMTRGGRTFYFGSADAAAAAQRLIDRLSADSKPGQRLLVGPEDLRLTPYSDAFFYYLFPELPPATKYIEMDPGIANAPGSGLADEVRSADWLVLSNVWTGWDEPNDSRRPGPDEPNRVVEQDFCKVADYEGADGGPLWFTLYRKC